MSRRLYKPSNFDALYIRLRAPLCLRDLVVKGPRKDSEAVTSKKDCSAFENRCILRCVYFVYTSTMKTDIKKWGNSLGIRIPKPFTESLGLSEGTRIQIEIRDGAIVIRPIYSLDLLLSQITPEHLHDELDPGETVGEEEW